MGRVLVRFVALGSVIAALVACGSGSISDGTQAGSDSGATVDAGGDVATSDGSPTKDSAAPGDARADSTASTDAKKDDGVEASPPSDAGSDSPIDSGSAKDSGAPTGLLVGYYATWTRTTMPPSTIPWSKLTHVAHAFVLPASAGGLQDVAGYVDAELIADAHANGVKVVASVGGAGANFDGNTSATNRAKTVAALADLCSTYGYDGIDIDWEFPDATTASSWKALITELRTALDAIDPSLTISAAVASDAYNGDALPSDGLLALSWIGVMTYDYAGSWSSTSGYCSPLYPSKGGDGGSVSDSMDYYLVTRAMPADKVLLGLPFYGAEFGASAIDSTPIAPASAPDYRDVVPMMGTAGWTTAWDDAAKVPYLHRSASPGFVSYDDATSIGDKCTYAKSRSVHGAIIWHLAGDRLSDGTDPLLDAAQPCR